MEVSKPVLQCACESEYCNALCHAGGARCMQRAEFICHAFGLAVPMCGNCREQWEQARPDTMWTEGVRRHFSGEIVVGRDMMEL